MRVRHRWLLLSIFVAALLIVLAILGSRRTDHSPPSISFSFLGYTNLPNAKVRFAVFLVHDVLGPSVFLDNNWDQSAQVIGPLAEVEGLGGHKPHAIKAKYRLVTDHNSGVGSWYSFAVDEPLESGRWRVSCPVHHIGLRLRLLLYEARHPLLPKPWLSPLLLHNLARERSNYVTYSSIWLTNSP